MGEWLFLKMPIEDPLGEQKWKSGWETLIQCKSQVGPTWPISIAS